MIPSPTNPYTQHPYSSSQQFAQYSQQPGTYSPYTSHPNAYGQQPIAYCPYTPHPSAYSQQSSAYCPYTQRPNGYSQQPAPYDQNPLKADKAITDVYNQCPSKSEIVSNAAGHAAGRIALDKCSPYIEAAIIAAGVTCQSHPSLIVATAVTAIAVKEHGSKVAKYVKPVAEPVINIADKYPKTTLLTTSTICSTLLPYAFSGEPITVTATAASCSAAFAAFTAYLLKKDS